MAFLIFSNHEMILGAILLPECPGLLWQAKTKQIISAGGGCEHHAVGMEW